MQKDILPFKKILPDLHETVFIAPGAKVIGNVQINAGSSIWYGCVVRGDVNEIKIGQNVNIQDGTVIHVASRGQGTYIADNVSVGHMALLHACTIGAGSFIGMKAVLMDGVTVEPGAMVAAGALVTPGKTVRQGELWTGWPAKVKREISEEEKGMMAWTYQHYKTLARDHYQSQI